MHGLIIAGIKMDQLHRMLTQQQVLAILDVTESTLKRMEYGLKLVPFRLLPNTPIFREGDVLLALQSQLVEIERKNRIPRAARAPQVPPKRRWEILQRDRFRCCICGRNAKDDNVKLEVDHKVSISHGGTNDSDNLWTLCFDCNRGKTEYDIEE